MCAVGDGLCMKDRESEMKQFNAKKSVQVKTTDDVLLVTDYIGGIFYDECVGNSFLEKRHINMETLCYTVR